LYLLGRKRCRSNSRLRKRGAPGRSRLLPRRRRRLLLLLLLLHFTA
jgi:hypothetical protein